MNDTPEHKSPLRSALFYVIIILAVLGVVFVLNWEAGDGELSYAQVRQLFVQEQVDYFEVSSTDELTLRLKEPQLPGGPVVCRHQLASVDRFYEDLGSLIREQQGRGILQDYTFKAAPQVPWWLSMLPTLLMVVALGAFLYVIFSRRSAPPAGGGGPADRVSGFGRAKPRTAEEGETQTTFADVAGADEEKEELQELVEFLKDPQRFTKLGARVPKGVLLVGPPGTGKTLLAKAVAGEAGVKFLSISGSDFVELYVGVGASRVRDLFHQAKEDAPAIVFIDEIDAVGRQRGAGLGGGHDEREQTLNQLLVEMDGFQQNAGVIVMAATNRRDILDPALLRPGRFDRQIYVGYPDVKGREEILKVHARNKPLAEDVSLKQVAQATAGFTGADLENLLNEAALLAAREDRGYIVQPDLHEAMMKVIAGPEKKSRVISPQAKRLTAYHEAGHAVVIHDLPTADPVHQITVIPRGASGGMTISLPQEDRPYRSRTELQEDIAACLGGRCAERLVLGDISTGAQSDLEKATATAHAMVAKYGMSDALGNVVFDTGHDEVFLGRSMAQTKPYSEEIAGQIDREVRALIDAAERTCQEILTRRRAVLDAVAQYLLEHETMDAETFEGFYKD